MENLNALKINLKLFLGVVMRSQPLNPLVSSPQSLKVNEEKDKGKHKTDNLHVQMRRVYAALDYVNVYPIICYICKYLSDYLN